MKGYNLCLEEGGRRRDCLSLLFLLLLLGDNPSMQDAMPMLNIVTALTNSYANTGSPPSDSEKLGFWLSWIIEHTNSL